MWPYGVGIRDVGAEKPVLLRMPAHELTTGAEAVQRVCELARQGENVEGGRRSRSLCSEKRSGAKACHSEAASGRPKNLVVSAGAPDGLDSSAPRRCASE